MALGDPQQDDIENPPVSIVAPWNTDMDLSTTRFAPMEYLSMLGDALGINKSQGKSSPFQITESPIIPFSQSGYPALSNSYPPQGESKGELDPIQTALNHTISPESRPLIDAIDHGVADKKFMNPIEQIREGIRIGDEKMIHKGHKALSETISGPESFGEWWNETMAGKPGKVAAARKMAGDIVMKELATAAGGVGTPGAEEANRLGLIQPSELLPGQTEESLMSIPRQGPFEFTPEGVNVDTSQMSPAMESQMNVRPGARLTPFQQEIVDSRQKALQQGAAWKAALAAQRGDYLKERGETERYKRDVEGPAKIAGMNFQNALRKAQTDLAYARVEWYQQLPELRKQLSGSSSLEIEALKRVHQAIRERKPIDKADWFVVQPWLRKGSSRFGTTFTGRAFDKLTGQVYGKEGPLDFLGIPEAPSTLTEEQQTGLKQVDEDMFHELGSFLGSLLEGITGTKGEDKAGLPKPKTPEEAAKLKPGTRYLTPDNKEMVR